VEIPFVGPTYNLETREAAVQRTINMEPLPQEPGNERTAWVFQDVPGLVLATDFPAVATETVLFLFHMIGDEPTSEGAAEFVGPGQAFDQTGANWDATNVGSEIFSSFPYPKFGVAGLLDASGVMWVRDDSPTNPEVPGEFSTVGKTTLQISTWIFVQANSTVPPVLLEISVGKFAYPFGSSTLILRVTGDGDVFQAQVAWQPSDFGEQSSNPASVPTYGWVNLVLSYYKIGEFANVELYIDGVFSGGLSEVDLSGVLEDMNPINDMFIQMAGPGVYIDEARSTLGGTAIFSDFTPPVAPWPNP
jgi:hypothetical protein